MGIEIERKFLIKHLPSSLMTNGTSISQGYMVNKKDEIVRIRLFGEQAFLTIKGITLNASRKEFEYKIPKQDAREMLSLFCDKKLIKKTRYQIEFNSFEWIIDVFSGNNKGLAVAEIELLSIDQPFKKPDWVGKEVTHDPKYFNANLIKKPYSTW